MGGCRIVWRGGGWLVAREAASIQDRGQWRYRNAQGVLELPADFADYMRGRHRQAIRTNVGHARRSGLTVFSCAIDDWARIRKAVG